ncbi:hypothetical protein MSG28_007708 [Choristoneura fumiferana]|uniref:Uncharacterized protein n=1 Tax=Choristoneura fumiferana TaxID=7141 RepID=A0ACC0JYJ2_CHOFU|nr:hypothetical protein MSG28_007708 [Choristoneura fumiferana]
MVWIFALVATIIPAMALGAWGTYEVVEDVKVTELVTRMCTLNGAEDKVPKVLDAVENYERCVIGLFKDETLLQEVAAAIRNGDLNGVYKKYCSRAPQLANCSFTLLDSIALCGGNAAITNLPAARNVVDQLLGFICHNDGERIALFIQEGGPQCFQQNAANLAKCTAYVVEEIESSQAPNERCKVYDHASNCIVSTLSGCEPPTPANMTQALFANVRQAMPCAGADDTFRMYKRWLEGRSDSN